MISLDPAAFLEVVHVEGLALDFLAVFLGHGGGAGVLVQDDDDAAVVLDVVDDGGVVGEEADLGAEDGGPALAESFFRAEDGVPELEEVAGADVLGAFDVFAPDVVDVGSVRGETTGAGGSRAAMTRAVHWPSPTFWPSLERAKVEDLGVEVGGVGEEGPSSEPGA